MTVQPGNTDPTTVRTDDRTFVMERVFETPASDEPATEVVGAEA